MSGIIEKKGGPAYTKAIADRTVTGIFAVHGNIDSGRDRSVNGSFAAAIATPQHCRFLWGHDSDAPPVAKIDAIREVGRDGLPDRVKADYPEATGGVEVVRTYLETPRGDEVLSAIAAGAITEMSYAYTLEEWKFVDLDNDDYVREILKIKTLYDISDVNWGMNPATAAAGKGRRRSMSLADEGRAALALVSDLKDRVLDLAELRKRDGRAVSPATLDQVARIKTEIVSLVADLDQLAAATTATAAIETGTAKADALAAAITFARLRAQALGAL